MLFRMWEQNQHTFPLVRAKLREWLNPVSQITVPAWRHHWNLREKARTMIVSRIFFLVAFIAYIFHFFLVDLPAGKEPTRLWLNFRFGMAGFSLMGLMLTFFPRFCGSEFYKLPLIMAACLFSYMQARSMLWAVETPLFLAFVLPCLSVLLLKWNIAASSGLFIMIQALQYPLFWRAGMEPHVLTSASMISLGIIIVLRAGMVTDVKRFISQKHQKELRKQLNHYLKESRKKGDALKRSNEDLSRKADQFRGLLDASHSMARHQDLSALFEDAVSRLGTLFPKAKFAILFDQGEDKISHLIGNLPADLFQFLVQKHSQLMDEKILAPLKKAHRGGLEILPLRAGGDKSLGKIVVLGLELEQESYDTIGLFAAALAGFAQNVALMNRLETMAHMDSLTEAYNRNFFDERLDQSIAEHKEDPSKHFSVLLVDVNGLKEVNDTYGHKSGDQLIVSVAQLLKNTCRKSDYVHRIGGDEFVILCPATRDASPLLERLRQAERRCFIQLEPDAENSTETRITEQRLPLRFSVGMASTIRCPSHKLLKVADEAMYRDKKAYYANAS